MRKTQGLNQDIIEFSTLETNCVYQENKKMKMEYKYIKNSPLNLNTKLVQRGWRRFGNYFSRPVCRSCKDCISVKIDVENFTLSRSAKRVYKKNKEAGTKILIKTPSSTPTHIELYKKYHEYMNKKKGWELYHISETSYYDLYVAGHSFYGKDILYFVDGKLVGVDLVDFLEDGISAIYFYYDPDYSHLSLGRYSIYKQIDFAKEMGLKWIYLGYAVENCDSLNYKFDYKPQKRLINNPELEDEAIWL
jgi:arginine-tRNA-protein transferase